MPEALYLTRSLYITARSKQPVRQWRLAALLPGNNLAPSMSRRGNCWDNAMAKSFFSSLKKERIRKRIYKTKDLARADIFDYIEVFYNRPGATVISAASARKPPNRPRREDRICLQAWGQSKARV